MAHVRLLGTNDFEEEAVPIDLDLSRPLSHVVTPDRPMRVGLLGCGAVGSEVAKELLGSSEVSLAGVAVAHPDKPRAVDLPSDVLTDDALRLVKDPSVDLIVELIGGLELPYALLRQALVEGKSVVTANKEVVAVHGPELLELATERGVGFHFEAAAGGAVPVVRTVAESFAGDRIRSITGILNGTSNFILGTIASKNLSMAAGVELAKSLGYAEQDPSDDIDGIDAARKAVILGWLAFGHHLRHEDVFVRGIRDLSESDVRAAQRLGFATKLVVRVTESSGFVRAGVEPEAIPFTDPLARVGGSQNMIVVTTDLAGDVYLGGPGAGGRETTSAVLGDVERVRSGVPSVRPRRSGAGSVLDASDSPGRYLVRCGVRSRAAYERVTGCLFAYGIGVDRIESLGRDDAPEISLVTTYSDRGCVERALAYAGDDLESRSILKIGGTIDVD